MPPLNIESFRYFQYFMFYVLFISGICTEKMGVPKNVFDVVKRQNNGLQRDIKIEVEALWQQEIFHFEIVKYLNFSKCLKTHLLICLGWLTRLNQTDWHLFPALTNDVSICVCTLKGQIQLYWQHIFCAIWSSFRGKSMINPGGFPIFQNTNQFIFSSFRVDPGVVSCKFHGNLRDSMYR